MFDLARNIALIAFCVLLLANCAANRRAAMTAQPLLRAPAMVISHETSEETLYTLTTYGEADERLLVLRDREGVIIAALHYWGDRVFIRRPSKLDVELVNSNPAEIEDELRDIFDGLQRTFSFVIIKPEEQ